MTPQLSMFGEAPVKEGTYYVYHDESGTDAKHDRFMLHGALFVPESQFQKAFDLLLAERGTYEGRIHFVDLRDKSAHHRGKVARRWLYQYFGNLSEYCYYKCMLIDTQSPYFDRTRFHQPFHLYNYAAMLAVFGGIVWSFNRFDKINLRVYSEMMSRTWGDNFRTYLPSEITARVKRRQSKRGGNLLDVMFLNDEVVEVSGDPSGVSSEMAVHCEFIQLTDLLTSAIGEAVNARASQKIKIDLAKLLASWIEDSRRPPWLQNYSMHRRFSASCFPKADGGFYDCPLEVIEQNQLELF
jgi:hypothetical protein